MRQNVSDHLKRLPNQVGQQAMILTTPMQMKKDTIDVVFLGKPRGLSDLAHRQRKPGQWVGLAVLMVQMMVTE